MLKLWNTLKLHSPGVRKMSVFSQIFNPVTGRVEWVSQREGYDFKQEIARSSYADMLHDNERNEKYFLGIRHSIALMRKEGKEVHVLDIGAGTGLLSMMAVTCGADSVTACEAFPPVADCATKIIEANGFQDKIKLVGKRSTEMEVGTGKDLERRANLLVTEVFDTELIGEGALETFIHAKRELLTADAYVVPSKANIYAQVVSSGFVQMWNNLSGKTRNIDSKVHNIDSKNSFYDIVDIPRSISNCGGSGVVFDLQLSQLDGASFSPLSGPIKIFHFDWSGRESPLLKNNTNKSVFECQHDGSADAIFVWWDITMDQTDEVILSCAPYWEHPGKNTAVKRDIPWRDHWMQSIYFPPVQPSFKKGQQAQLLSYHDEYSLWFKVEDNNTHPLTDKCHTCSCGLHLLPRSRIAQVNDPRRISFYEKHLLANINKDTVALVIGDACLWSIFIAKMGALHTYIVESGGGPTRKVLQEFICSNGVSGKVTILPSSDEGLRGIFVKNKINLVFSEPFFLPALLGFHSLLFMYKLNVLKFALADDVLILPGIMKIKAVPVHFKDLWKIRAPVKECCGFKMNIFDQLVGDAMNEADSNVEPQPLWEYPCWALCQQAVTLYEMVLGPDLPSGKRKIQTVSLDNCLSQNESTKAYTDLTNGLPEEEHLLKEKVERMEESTGRAKDNMDDASMEFSQDEVHSGSNGRNSFSPRLNGLAIWCDWDFGGESFSMGPTEKIASNNFVKWDPYTKQGVYFFTEQELRAAYANKREDTELEITAVTSFNPDDGAFAFEFSVR